MKIVMLNVILLTGCSMPQKLVTNNNPTEYSIDILTRFKNSKAYSHDFDSSIENEYCREISKHSIYIYGDGSCPAVIATINKNNVFTVFMWIEMGIASDGYYYFNFNNENWVKCDRRVWMSSLEEHKRNLTR
jgi:hypothetical protein